MSSVIQRAFTPDRNCNAGRADAVLIMRRTTVARQPRVKVVVASTVGMAALVSIPVFLQFRCWQSIPVVHPCRSGFLPQRASLFQAGVLFSAGVHRRPGVPAGACWVGRALAKSLSALAHSVPCGQADGPDCQIDGCAQWAASRHLPDELLRTVIELSSSGGELR